MVAADRALDVTARWQAHLENLRVLAEAPPRVALIGLPLPPIVDAIGRRSGTIEARSLELSAIAEELGGGDGAAVIVDLERDGRAIDAILGELGAAGVEEIVLHGAREQPGLARALALRFDGAVRWAPARSQRALRGILDAPAMDPEAIARGWAFDPERRFGAWSGFLPPGAERGPADALRAAWRERFGGSGHAEGPRCAALGLDPLLEARLRSGAAPRSASRHRGGPFVIAVTGIDGSGKSTHAAALAEALGRRGLVARVVKMYRRGAFLAFAEELGARTRRGASLAAFRVARIVKMVDSLRALRDEIEPAAACCDVLVFDRHVETHVAAARAQLGWELAGHPLLELFPAADLTFLLDLDPADAPARIAARGEPLSADEHAVGLEGYARAFWRFAADDPERWVVLDARASFSVNAAMIAARVTELMEAADRGATGRRAALRRPPSRPSPVSGVERGTGCAVRSSIALGCEAAQGTLGSDVLALATFARERLGARAGGVPEALWIEAYAAQVALDLDADRGTQRAVALWPEALARVPLFADLGMLEELSRMIRHRAMVTHYLPGGGAAAREAFAILAPTAASRLSHAYGSAVDALAVEHGWPAGS